MPRMIRCRAGLLAGALVATAVVACTPTGPVTPGTPTRGFVSRTEIDLGIKEFDVQVGDLNHDGRLDLVGVSGANPTSLVSVELANAAGGYATHVDYAAGGIIQSIELGDVNNDGNLDVVAVNGTGGTVTVLLGHADGTLGSPVVTTVGGRLGLVPSSAVFALGKIDGDAFLDGVVTDATPSGRLIVLHGVGDGTFTFTNLASALPYTRSVTLADMNGDHKLDAITVSDGSSVGVGDGIVSINLGVGDGTFGARSDQPIPTNSLKVMVGDINGDGKPDVVTPPHFSATYTSQAFTLLGDGGGNLAPVVVTGHNAQGGFEEAALVDLNGDGRSDLVSLDFNNPELDVSLASPAGGFDEPEAYLTTNATSGLPRIATVADMDGDGRPDLVWSDGRQNRVSVFHSRVDGTLAAAGRRYPTGGRGVITDVTGDGRPDLVSTYGSGKFAVAAGRGDGTLHAVVTYPTGGTTTTDIAVADVNGDLAPDVITADQTGGKVWVSTNTGTGFAAAVSYAVGAQPVHVLAADFNGDGKPDLATVDTGAGGVSVLLNTGTGTFAAATAYAVGATPAWAAAGDLNADGKVDLAVTNSGANVVAVLLNAGGATFAAHVDIPTSTTPKGVAIADMNGDGKADLVVASEGTAFVSVHPGVGNGTFQPRVDSATGAKIRELVVADFDGDGRRDVFIGPFDTSAVTGAGFMRGDGAGGLASPVTYQPSNINGESDLVTGDIDGNGTPDVSWSVNGSKIWMLTR